MATRAKTRKSNRSQISKSAPVKKKAGANKRKATRPRARPAPDAKRAAVIGCVNNALDANQPGWNSDGNGNNRKMGADFGYNTNSMPSFLGVVKTCLAPAYTLNVNAMSMTACVGATVDGLKGLVYQNCT